MSIDKHNHSKGKRVSECEVWCDEGGSTEVVDEVSQLVVPSCSGPLSRSLVFFSAMSTIRTGSQEHLHHSAVVIVYRQDQAVVALSNTHKPLQFNRHNEYR